MTKPSNRVGRAGCRKAIYSQVNNGIPTALQQTTIVPKRKSQIVYRIQAARSNLEQIVNVENRIKNDLQFIN